MIAVDTTLFIYVLNADHEFGHRSAAILDSKEDKVASEIVFAEVFSITKLDEVDIRHQTQKFLEELKIEYVSVTKEVFLLAGSLRRQHSSLKLADAVHLASALQAGADTFVTNDQDLVKLKIKGLKIISL